MCVVLPAEVTAIEGSGATVRLHGGAEARVSLALASDVARGDHVLVDRGFIIRVIPAEEAEAIRGIYAELERLVGEDDE